MAKDKARRRFDPVARFDLGNGAQVQLGAEDASKGRAQSFGAMMNYLYDQARVDQNHEGYATKAEIAALAKAGPLCAEIREVAHVEPVAQVEPIV
jgi:malonyl-CoA decarboxylase